MRCPFCQAIEDKVVDTRPSDNEQVIRRRRECTGCTRRFTTYERVEEMLPLVVKKDGRREPFDRRKLLAGPEEGLREAAGPDRGARARRSTRSNAPWSSWVKRRSPRPSSATPRWRRCAQSGRRGLPALRLGLPVVPGRRRADARGAAGAGVQGRRRRERREPRLLRRGPAVHAAGAALAERGRGDHPPQPGGRRGGGARRPGGGAAATTSAPAAPTPRSWPSTPRGRPRARRHAVRHARALLPHRPHGPLHRRGCWPPACARVVVGCIDENPQGRGQGHRAPAARPACGSTSAAWRRRAGRPTGPSSSGSASGGRW